MPISKIESASLNSGVPAAANMPTGSVLQVVSSTSSSGTSTTGTSYVATTITASITPKFSTSKILVISSWWQNNSASGSTTAATLYRNSTDLGNPSYGFTAQYLPNTAGETTGVITYLDSPSTTSSTTYTIYVKRMDAAGTATIGNSARTSVMTLMEIAA